MWSKQCASAHHCSISYTRSFCGVSKSVLIVILKNCYLVVSRSERALPFTRLVISEIQACNEVGQSNANPSSGRIKTIITHTYASELIRLWLYGGTFYKELYACSRLIIDTQLISITFDQLSLSAGGPCYESIISNSQVFTVVHSRFTYFSHRAADRKSVV